MKINNYNFDEKLRSFRDKVMGISAETSRVRNRPARTEASESEGQSSTRITVNVMPNIEGRASGPFVWALALGASLFLALPITLFPSENQNAVTSVVAINMLDLTPLPAPSVQKESLPLDQLDGVDDWRGSPSGMKHNHAIASVIGAEGPREDPLDQFTNLNRNAPEPFWYRIQPKEKPDQAITIMMPDDATFRESYTRSPLGKVSHHTYTAKGKGATLTASYSLIPKIARSLVGEKTIFIKARDTVLERANGEQNSMEPTQYMGIAGMKLVYTTRPLNGKPSFNGVAYMFISGQTLVVFNAVLSNQPPRGFADRYFESIEVTHSPAAAERLNSNS